ncbi:MAG: bifunctional diaminohydroxyphosphoribosylaminopyrimidine deaminase/5-amino-6-(5-phosphoribosylamino)uracil reductase RibD [Melioribacteraceae bacterium]|nr:bifunctional diaminohydroxyphosphoribosylaminopyrimidine deaminase/5-amino-6-(5-phosphoribosylamino)uracil reductase RibD [Melioribacteraceae bacterium]
MENIDKKYMRRCLELAEHGRGAVSPNPLVGCVIVKDDKIISENYHRIFGGPHAEALAITNSSESVSGATLYVNLEPCCHENKKTPPCVPSIIMNDIKRVVIANVDPNPEVKGKGIKILKEAGIEVVTGVSEKKGKQLNRFFFKYIKSRMPYVTLKIAKSLDGKINDDIGSQTQITGVEANIFVHQQRSYYDAVMVGANTVGIDNPQLTVRHIEGRDPYRIVLDDELISPVESQIFTDGNQASTWLFTRKDSNPEKINSLKKNGVRVIELQTQYDGLLDLKEVLAILGEENISSLFVEGGQRIFSEFIGQKLFDEIIFLSTPKLFGKGLDAVKLTSTIELELVSLDKLGDDIKSVFRKK